MGNRELINKFLAYLKMDGRSVLTLSAYATDLKQWEKVLGDKRIEKLDIEEIERLPRRFAPRNDLKVNSLARKLTSLREFLRWGYRKGYLKQDLAAKIEIPRKKTIKEPNSISLNKIARLRRTADVKERLILELILGAGMKLSEIVKIRMKQVTSYKLQVASNRTILITGQLQQAMDYYLAAYSRGPRSTLIFSERTGREITARTATNILNKLAKKARIRGITARNLRRK